MADYLQLNKDKKEEQSELETRWKSDEDLLYLKKYVMQDANGKKIDDIVNVTLNRPAVFGANVVSAMASTSEQRVVESENKDIDTAYIEGFQKAAFAAANDRLRKQGLSLLNPFADVQFCFRGAAARRVLFRMGEGVDGEVLIADIANWDRRYVTYERGIDGLEWAAYETLRSKGAIKAEYDIEISGKTGDVLDVWHMEGNEVWIDGKKQFDQAHDFGFTPVVIEVVSLGYGAILLSEGSRKYEGESIFFLIRGVEPEINRLVSIMQTLNLKAIKRPIAQKIKGKKPGEYDEIMASGAVTSMEPGDSIEPINYGDAQRSATLALNMMSVAFDEGTISSADLGTIEAPPASGVRAIMAGEHINNLLAPRLAAKAGLNEQTVAMFTEQAILIGGSVELGVRGHKTVFETSKLQGEYSTSYKYTFKSPSTDAGLVSLAAAYGHLIPDRAKREEILKREDPDEDYRQLKWEEAERLSPNVKMRRIVNSLIEQGEPEEAQLITDEAGVNLDRLLSGDVAQQPQPEGEEKPTQVLSLFGGGVGRVSPEVEEEE